MLQDSTYKQFRCVVRSEIEPKDKNVLWWNMNDSALYSFYNGVWIKDNSLEIKNLYDKINEIDNKAIKACDNFIENNIVFLTADKITDSDGNNIYSLIGNWKKRIENDNTIYELIN